MLTQADFEDQRQLIRDAAEKPGSHRTFMGGRVPRWTPSGERDSERTPPPKPKGRRDN